MVFTGHLRAKHRFHEHEEVTDTLTAQAERGALSIVALSSFYLWTSKRRKKLL